MSSKYSQFLFYFTLIKRSTSTELRNWYAHNKKIIVSSFPPGRGDKFLSIAPMTRMYQVVHRLYTHPHNEPSTGDGGKKYSGDADNLSMCKIIRESVTITDVLETSYA